MSVPACGCLLKVYKNSNMKSSPKHEARNVLGTALAPCCFAPKTGFYRDGYCRTDEDDQGKHVVCAEMTEAFLVFSLERGNDLSTPRPEFGFSGLSAGDRWCLCLLRWKEALRAGCAPSVVLESCDESCLEHVSLEDLMHHAVASFH